MAVYLELRKLILTVPMDDALRQALDEILRRLEVELSALNTRIEALE